MPLPELGPVEPVLWDELEAGADWLVLTISGTALENAKPARKPPAGMFTAELEECPAARSDPVWQ